MHCYFHRATLLMLVALWAGASSTALAGDEKATAAPLVEKYLESGELAKGEAALLEVLAKNPKDDQAQFSLGVVRFLRAIERLGQAHYKYGLLQHRTQQIPLLRMPVPPNKSPEELSYAEARKVIQQLLDDLKATEATLAKVDTTNVKLPLHFGRIRLDLDGDGKATDSEVLWRIFAAFNRGVNEVAGTSFVIAFDGGDVHWLRGYCHLLMSFGEAALAHDWHELFERCGHLLYPRVKTPYKYLAEERTEGARPLDFRMIADIVAFIHLINFPVEEPARMQSALEHLEAMIDQSRASWKRILAETDDDREWLPNPKQTGVIPNVRVSQEMIDGWHEFLDEAEAILKGKKLVPFWRGWSKKPEEVLAQGRGVNLRRVFTEPRQFDLVMWVSGTGAVPYLEKGELTDPQVWTRLMRVFRGEIFGFAIWFN